MMDFMKCENDQPCNGVKMDEKRLRMNTDLQTGDFSDVNLDPVQTRRNEKTSRELRINPGLAIKKRSPVN